MPKAVQFASILGVAIILGGLGYVFLGRDASAPDGKSMGSESDPLAGVTINDPSGVYKPYMDPSITRGIPAGTVWGNGQTISIDYDGSKTTKDGKVVEGSVFYQTYYVGTSGSVYPMSGGVFVEGPKGTYKADNKTYTSAADGRPGFVEVSVVQDSGMKDGQISGKNVNIGMFPIKFQVAE